MDFLGVVLTLEMSKNIYNKYSISSQGKIHKQIIQLLVKQYLGVVKVN